MRTKRELLVRLSLLAAVFAIQLLAQGDRGVITGTVTDPSGATVPNAVIVVIQNGTNASYKVTTSSAGAYTVPSLPIGSYQVRVNVSGFKPRITDNVTVNPGGETRLDIKLEVGTSQQTVEVMANAQTIQTENAKVSTSVSETMVDALPVEVNGTSRSPFDLAADAAGEVNASGTFRIGGGIDTVGIALDGSSMAGDKIGSDAGDGNASAIMSPSVEALTEFTVETSGFKAETGHVSGGVLSFVSKSGTNQFHGSAFEFLRNQDFDAKTFFADANNQPKSIYKQNNFGVTAGGPVYIPKLYNGKNKTFFFASYEGFRNRVGAATGSFDSVPPSQFYKGDLSDWVNGSGVMYQVYDPTSQVQLANGTYQRTPFPNNQIPQTRFDPTAAAIASYVSTILAPNRPGIVPGTFGYVNQNYIVNPNGTTNSPDNKWSAKIDQNLGSKHHLSYLMDRGDLLTNCGAYGCTGLPAPIGSNANGYDHTQLYRGNWDWTISPTFLSRFYGGFNYYREDHGNTEGMTQGSPQSAGIGGLLPATFWTSKNMCLPGFDLCQNMPIISTGDFTGLGGVAANGSDRLVFEMHEDMTKTSGKHTFKWGYFFGDSHYDGFGVQYGSGAASFSYLGTSVPQAGSEASGGGSGFASFLLGQVNGYNLDTPRYLLAFYRTHQFYVQDDWKVSRKLTLNIGIRYEIDLAPISGSDRLSTLDYSLPNPAAGGILGATEFAGSCQGCTGSRNLIPSFYGGYAPRLSLAYAINDKTVIRAAASRSFGPVAGIGQSSHQLGYAIRDTVNNPSNLFPVYTLNNGPGINLNLPDVDPGVGVGQNPPSYGFNGSSADKPDDELNYSFNIQRQITNTQSFEVGYVATFASDISSDFLADNQLRFNSLPPALSPFTASGRAVLSSLITSSTAINAGAVQPWTCGSGSAAECIPFTKLWGSGASVTQANLPYPQYGTIDTTDGGGDRIGHSTYNALLAKYTKRLSNGLTIQSSYSFSKILTDSSLAYAATTNYGDMYNLRLLKSIASYDQTHLVKLTYVYELPIGKGKHFLAGGGVAAAIVGGWRISGIQSYGSGLPMNISTDAPSFDIGAYSNPPTVSTYKGWAAPYSGRFNPYGELYLQPQPANANSSTNIFPAQSSTSFGNSTTYNPDFRSWPQFNEDLGLSRTFPFKERFRLEFRGESFNVFNRVWFGPISGATSLGNPNWGKWQSQVNTPRVMQLTARMTW
jgi:hypothetical protein